MLFSRGTDSDQLVPTTHYKSKSNFVKPTLNLGGSGQLHHGSEVVAMHDSKIFCHSP